MLRLLPALLLALLVFTAPASAGAPRCAKHTIVIGPKQRPRACLPKTLPAADPAVLKSLLDGKPDRTLEKLAARRFRARAAVTERDGDLPPGVELSEKDGVVELRRKSGASVSMGLDKHNVVPSCPQATGDVPAKLDETFTFGFATAEHGKRTWALVTMRNEATWTGHVGAGAKAETFDVAFRGELTIKSGVEIAATGKVLKRHPTRTYRSALTKKGVPVKVDPLKLALELTFRGPKGQRGDARDLEAATGLFKTSLMGLMEIPYALEQGDKHWYDERACAEIDFTWAPEKVVKGGRADWNVWVNAQDGARAADARWAMTSGCGALSAATLSGPTVTFGVADGAGAWAPESEGACAQGEITSTAGRPRAFDHHVPPMERKRWRYDIRVDFKKDMGSGIAQTNAVGVGRVTVGEGEGYVDGEGEFFGSEWDSGIGNPCGHDMLRTRAFSTTVVTGAKIEGDQVTIAFTAVERLFENSWILKLPLTGGEEFYTSFQPFCGDPKKALHTSTIKVTGTPVS